MFFDELKENREKPTDLIFGTDWWTDCDDVAALSILLKAHNCGLINLKAIGVSSVMRYTAPSVRAVCDAQGLGDIPIGLDTSAVRRGILCLYQKKLASFCKTGFTNADCPEAYKLYRKALTFLGYEVGKTVITGGREAPGLVGAAYEAHRSPRGRPSWDPMTALFAVTGDAAKAGYRRVFGRASVDPKTGRNSFEAFAGGPHSYLVKEKEDRFYQDRLNEILFSEQIFSV
ncbi:MAG: hypothetical protein IJR51_10675 [Clostridia bacterium]|nr:hypothetical protein [Clostridia bacterium]